MDLSIEVEDMQLCRKLDVVAKLGEQTYGTLYIISIVPLLRHRLKEAPKTRVGKNR